MDMGQKLGRGLRPLFGECSWVPILHKVALAEAYLHTKWHLNPRNHLTTTDMAENWGLRSFCGSWVPI